MVNPRRGLAICVIQRVLLAVVGGYWLSAGILGLGALGIANVIPRSETVVLTAMLGFGGYLVLLLWAFAERRLIQLRLVLGAGPVAVWAMLHAFATLAGGG